MRVSRLILLVCFVFSCISMQAQMKVTGSVTDAKEGSTLSGVTITVKKSKTTAITSSDGTFSISAPAKSVLVFSYVGYQSQEMVASDNLLVKLSKVENSLSEVIVTGYGSKIRRDITGSIAKVGASELANTPVTSFENALQGRAAGVFVEQQNGKLGQGIKVRVRGSASVTAGDEPFYVIDGIPVVTTNLSSNGASTSPLADINPNDIESIEVLKDASAAAIYGSRASNGVVLITTKKGKNGKTKIDFGYFTGTQKPTHLVQFMNAEEYVNYTRQGIIGAAKQEVLNGTFSTLQAATDYWTALVEGRLKRYSAGNDDYKTYKTNTDWQSLAFQDAPMSQYDLGLSGGNDKTTFYMSGQYMDQKGILLKNALKRYTGRINLENKVNSWLTTGINMNFVHTVNNRISNDDGFATPLQIVALAPITPTIDPRTGLTSGALDPVTKLPNTNFPTYYNPILSAENSSYVTTINRTLGNVYGNIAIANGLVFRSEFGMDQLNQTEDSYNGRLTRRDNLATYGTGSNNSSNVLNINTNNYLRYSTTINDMHNLDLTTGMSYQNYKMQANSISAKDFPSDDFKKLASAATNTAYSSSETQYSFLGYFTRANYKLKNRYILSLSGRFDASSRFGANNRWGFFPAASAGWVLSEEKFLTNATWLNFLKLKASYGLTGNAEIGDFAARGLYSGDASYGGNPGIRAAQIANPDLKWESTRGEDFGIEAIILKNRISIEADYYTRKTNDLLLNVEVPGTSGFSSQIRNTGKLENKGIELTLNTNNIVSKNFRWTTSLNYAANKNKVTDLGGQTIGTLNVAMEGQALGTFYAREYAGVDPANGDALYYKNTLGSDGKRDRSTTNDYNQAENVVIGNPNPKFTYGMRNTFSYKAVELDVLLQGVSGNQIYGYGGQYMSANGSNGFDNQTRDQLSAWKKPGDITNIPEVRTFYSNGLDNSSRYIYDGSYLRVKAVTLSYTVPSKIIKKLKLEKAKFYVRGQNLFTFTRYPLWDPEVNTDYSSTNIVQGRDFYSAPQAKTIVFGVNISL